jgi:hypothetical protein
MPLPESLAKRLRLPAIAAPMFLTSEADAGRTSTWQQFLIAAKAMSA